MLRHSLRGLVVAAAAALMLGPSPAAAVTPVNSCRTLDKAGETYVLTDNITATGDCFVILADRITLDLGGHTVTGPGDAAGVWDGSAVRTSTVVKNGRVTGFSVGISLFFGSRTTVRAVDASANGAIGIVVGTTSLVKDCLVQGNGNDGILTGASSQVEGCVVGGEGDDRNGRVGIVGNGDRVLVTRNTVSRNGSDGIRVANFGTVTHNTSNDNGGIGIVAGRNATVTHNTASGNGADGVVVFDRTVVSFNTANDNGDDGIQAVCPATVTHNRASNNDAENFHFIGDGCVDIDNTSPDEIGCLTDDSGLAAC